MAFKVDFDSPQSSKQTYFADITDRDQSRIVQNAWGWPIDHFTDLRELLIVIRDAIRDHQTMHKLGVLHRDVSAGNILIRPLLPNYDNSGLYLLGQVSKTEGRLIGLDNAKRFEGRINPRLDPKAGSDQIQKIIHQAICQVYGEDVAVHALKLVFQDYAFSYCAKAIASNVLGSPPAGKRTPADLGWEDVGAVPDYASNTYIVNERAVTGTIPFISHKLMARDKYAVHDAIHDLESFWWVIIYLCLTRESGGGHRRQNVSENVQLLVDDLFYNSPDRIGHMKASYFGKFGEKNFPALLELFSEYFKPLELMLTRWRSALVLGYNYKAYEYHLIHKYVLAIIEDQLNNPTYGPDTKQVSGAIENEVGRREEYALVCNIDHSQLGGSQPSTSISVGINGMSPAKRERIQTAVPRTQLDSQMNRRTP